MSGKLRWCSVHDAPLMVYSDESMRCWDELVCEYSSDVCVAVDPPEIARLKAEVEAKRGVIQDNHDAEVVLRQALKKAERERDEARKALEEATVRSIILKKEDS